MSKFKGLFDARRAQEDEEAVQVQKRGRGRPRGHAGGKRDNKAEYTQAAAYVRRDVHRRVKAALVAEEREYSELVEELLVEWLKSRK